MRCSENKTASLRGCDLQIGRADMDFQLAPKDVLESEQQYYVTPQFKLHRLPVL